MLLFALHTLAQQPLVFHKKGYTLIVTNNDAAFDLREQVKLVTTFFTVYPDLAKVFNKHTEKTVYLVIDTAYHGVAATADAHVRINPQWLYKHPEDIDVITHQLMHLVQDYGESVGPGWLTEGIADYARYKYGINNAAANWSLPPYKPTQNYTNSYRITARFLLWIETHIKKGFVKKIDEQLRDHTYTADSWQQASGKTLEQLWNLYTADPEV